MPEPIRIEFEVDGSDEVNTKVNSLLNRFDDLKKRVGDVKEELAGAGAEPSANKSIMDMAKGFAASGVAALAFYKIVDIGKEAIRTTVELVNDYADAVRKTPSLFSDAEIADVERYGRELEKINSLKMEFGKEALPAVSNATAFLADYIKTVSEFGSVFDLMRRGANAKAIRDLDETLQAVNSSDKAMLVYAKDAMRVVKIRKDLAEEVSSMPSISLFGAVQSAQGDLEKFNESQDRFVEKQDAIIESILALEKKGVGRYTGEMQALLNDLDEALLAQSESVRENKKNEAETNLEYARQILAQTDGMLTAEEERYLVNQGLLTGVFDETAATMALTMITAGEEIAAGFDSTVGKMTGAIDSLDNRTIDVYFNAHWTGFEPLGMASITNVGIQGTPGVVNDIPYLTQEILRRLQ